MESKKYCMPDNVNSKEEHTEYLKNIGLIKKEIIFEYKVDTCWGEDNEHEEWLNLEGKDGWEVVAVNQNKNSDFFRYVFKRQKQ